VAPITPLGTFACHEEATLNTGTNGCAGGPISGRATPPTFPVGYHRLHPDASLNFQMNRWLNWLGEGHDSALAEMRAVAPRIRDYADFVREFTALARRAGADGQPLKAAYYTRAAEFFMSPDDPARPPLRHRFLRLVRDHYGIAETNRQLVPYGPGMLPAYRFAPPGGAARGALVVFGGFDSYIEEWFAAVLALRDRGYDVVAFDGPGQGGALEEFGLPLTHAWERPLAAVLDHFALDDVTLIGFSLGGGLAIRAAAFEPRVRRVVADDVLSDFLAVNLRQLRPPVRALLRGLLALRAGRAVDALARRATARNLDAAWGLRQGMHVLGVATPHAYFRAIRQLNTLPVSHLVTQDVLLLAGSDDHYVPRDQFWRQGRALTRARSLTGRIFTAAEQAQNHCQVGNIALSLRVVADWIALVARVEATPGATSSGPARPPVLRPVAGARADADAGRRTGGSSDVGAD
jgi:pimeloyl-ACP methyl ester carboxylesterase